MKQKAFTLLEILLVIAAIGILAAIVIVAINPQRQLAQVRDAERQTDLNTLNSALGQYLIDQGRYPDSLESLPVGLAREVCAEGYTQAECQNADKVYLGSVVPRYIAAIPEAPNSQGLDTGYIVYRTNAGRLAWYTDTSEIQPAIRINTEGAPRPFVMRIKTDNAGSSNNNQFTIPTTAGVYEYTVDWGDGTVETGIAGDRTHTYASPGEYDITISGVFPRIFFNNSGDSRKLIDIRQWGDIAWVQFNFAFYGATEMRMSAIDSPDLGNVTDMRLMFRDAIAFDGDISGWDVSNVTNMQATFRNAQNFNANISDWDVSNVINMNNMFFDASSFNRDLSGWCVSAIPTAPTTFDLGAASWSEPRPIWGICP